MRFTRLKLTNWRNFRTADLTLRPRTFIVGPNASGKSNLLDAIRFLKELAEDGGGLQRAAVEQRGGFKALRSLHARTVTFVGIEVTTLADDGTEWTYELRLVPGDKDGRTPHVQREVIQRSSGLPTLSHARDAAREDREERTQTWLEQRGRNRGFRELAHFFASVEYSHIVPQVVREQRRPADQARRHDPYGSDLIEDMATTPTKDQRRRLKQINLALGAVLPQLENIRVNRDKVGRPHLEAKYKHWRKPGSKQNEAQFSDGTLRLIGLLWTLAKPGGPVLLEEPEISLHGKAVAQLPTIMHNVASRHGRQIIVSTHSEALLDDEGIEPREIAWLKPTHEDTKVLSGIDVPLLVEMASAGQRFGRELVAMTAPPDAHQLELFGSS